LERLRAKARELDPGAQVYVFGIARGTHRPDSYVDVLAVTSLAEIEEGRLLVRAELGKILSPTPQ
jgi:predicted nucleotidyltransferase